MVSGAAAAPVAEYAFYRDEGLRSIQHARRDSAFFWFGMAHEAGMRRDSLMYFWAETFLATGAPDSALVINYSIDCGRDTSFRTAVLKQRFIIYRVLQWNDKAQSLLDTLSRIHAAPPEGRSRIAWRKILIPTIYYKLYGDVSGEKSTVSLEPYLSESVAETGNGPSASGEFDLSWKIPAVIANVALKTGYTISHGRFSPEDTFRLDPATSDSRTIFDNMSHVFLVVIGLDGLLGSLFSIDYGFFANIGKRMNEEAALLYGFQSPEDILRGNQYRPFTLMHRLDGTCIWMQPRKYAWSGFVYAAADWFVDSRTNAGLGMDQVLMADASMDLHKGGTFDATLSLIHRTVASSSPPGDTMTRMYVNDVTLAGNSVVHFYRGTRDTIRVVTASDSIRRIINYTTQVDSMVLQNSTPNECLALNPVISYGAKLPWSLQATVSAGYSVNYYPRDYRYYRIPSTGSWQDPAFDWADYIRTQGDAWTAHNAADGRTYLATKPDAMKGAIDKYSIEPVSEITVKRIDQQVSIGIGIKRPAGWLGVIALSGCAWYSWSTLGTRAPVSVPQWEYKVSLQLDKKISFK